MNISSGLSQQEPLLATKLSIPPARPHLVSRPRLTRRLDEGMRYSLTLLSAPAGFGKTTLLSEWAAICRSDQQNCSSPIAWVSLDKGDNDPIRFWMYIIAALEMVQAGIGGPVLMLLHSSQPASIELILTTLINAIAAIPHNFALVLDDYHEIDAQPIHDGLTFLFEHLPQNMHLFIASRTDPPFPLARLRARGQLRELRALDLRFTPDEAATFLCQVLSFHLSPQDVAALEARTEGWIAGLQLAALSMRGREDIRQFIAAFTGEHRYIADYLFTEVLHRQPEHVQSFLLYTSILDRLAGSLCNAVTGQDDGQTMLEMLEQANLFLIPLDDQRHWYRYHQLFGDFLRDRLQQTESELVPELHRRASDWFERHELIAEAIDHALAAKDFEHAADLVEQIGETLSRRGEQKTVLQWLTALPDTQIRSRPRLCLGYAWVLLTMGQVDRAEQLLRDAERLAENASEMATIRATIAAMRGNVEQIIEHSSQALEHMPEGNLEQRSMIALNQGYAQGLQGDTEAAAQSLTEASNLGMAADNIYAAFMATYQLASMQMIQGKLHQAARTYQQALQLATGQDGQLIDMGGMAYGGIGMLQCEWNEIDIARYSILQCTEQAEKTGNTWILLYGYAMLAQVKQALGDKYGIHELLQKAERLIRGLPGMPTAEVATHWVNLCIMQGDLVAANHWVQACGLDVNDDSLEPLHMFGYLVFSRLLLAEGKLDEAIARLHRLQQAAEAMELFFIIIKTLVLQAVALYKQGNTVQAMTTLAEALSLAESEGYIRTFVDEGAPMAELLTKTLKAQQKGRLASYSFTPEYVSKLLGAFGDVGATLTLSAPAITHGTGDQLTVQPLIYPLSEREREVLRLIAAGLSNREITQKLVVEMNTLKTHIKHLYNKLNVQSRSQAIARARELNLV